MSRAAKPMRPDLEKMIALLKHERRALKTADMAALVRMAPRKSALLARLEGGVTNQTPQDKGLVQKVRQVADRNARLFEAALRGLNDARALVERCTAPHSDQTYARDGARALVDPPGGSLQKHA